MSKHSPFVLSNPLYDAATKQNFSNEKIFFQPMIDVLELLYANVAFGNFFINVIDFRDFSYPYNSPNSSTVVGHTPEGKDLEWLTTVLHPADLPIFLSYGGFAIDFIAKLPIEKKKRALFNHCYRIKHGTRHEYVWLYQQHHMSHLDMNAAIVYSISTITDVTHLVEGKKEPSWSVTEILPDGTSLFHIGSDESIASETSTVFSAREKEVLQLFGKGYTATEVAHRLHISYETVITHKKNILRKSKSKSVREAIAFAINFGYL